MAVAQSKIATAAAVAGSTGISITFNSTPTAGSALVVAVSVFEGVGSGVLTNPTDNKGNTYSPIGTAQSANGTQWEMQLFYCENCATSATHTITAKSTATTLDFTMCIIELSGRATSGALDATNQAGPTTSNAPNSGSITPVTGADSIGIVAADEFVASEPVKGASWTLVQLVDGSSSVVLGVESAVSFTGAANWTMAASHPWVAKVASFAAVSTATLDQEGFRFRNDDGSETTATWAAAQDTDATAPLAANLRLRAIVDTTGDAASTAYTLYHKLSTDSVYVPVPVGAAPFPVIEATAETAVSTAGTSHAIALPAGIVDTDLVMILMDIGSTSATLNSLTDWTEDLDESAANGLKILRYTGAGVPTTPTFTSSASTRSASIAYRISGADKTTAPQIGTTATGTSATPDPPSVTPTGGVTKSYLFLTFYGAAGEEADDDTWSDTPPTNYGPTPPLQKACGVAGTNLGGMIAAASRQLSTGSAEDPGTFAKDVSAAWRAQTIIIHPAIPPVYISPSANITAGGDATTAQLTAPSGKSGSDFTTGRIWDDENGVDAINIVVDDYTELEWSLQAQSPAVNTNIYQFRVYEGAAPLDSYTVTPQWTIGSGSFDGTATPSVIALAATIPAAVTKGGATVAPAAIAAGPVVIPQAVLKAGATASPASLTVGPVVMPAPTKTAGSLVSPAAIVAGPVVIPQAVAGTGSVVSPASITLTLTLPAVTTAAGSTALPAVIPLAVTIPQASATGGGAATALPAAITLAVSIPQATTQGGAVVTPAVIPLSVTIPQAVTKGGATVSPAVIPLAVTIPQATATGASPGTATPASITTQVTIPQATVVAGYTVAPGVLSLNVTMPAALPQASKTATPAVIPLTVTMPAATASGSTASTATPNAIALVTVLPSPTLRFGYVVNPNVIALAISIGAAIASGLAPDAHPITLTLRDAGHTVTVRVVGTTATVRDSGHTATARENR